MIHAMTMTMAREVLMNILDAFHGKLILSVL
jgi:hypothetical protein